MNRREWLAALAVVSTLEAAPDQEPESLYIPKAHLVEDRNFLHDFMDEYSFVDLVTAAPDVRITHIPCFLDRTQGRYGTIYGHISRQNPQSATFDGKHSAIVVFRGPHSYISPLWYAKKDVVPTWNFAVAHAGGKLKPVAEKDAFRALLGRLIRKNEGAQSAYDFEKLPDSYTSGLMTGIIGFSMEIERIEGKFKLGQERSATDKEGVLRGLQSAKQPRGIRELTAAFYERKA
jgi:transcriptional regulator